MSLLQSILPALNRTAENPAPAPAAAPAPADLGPTVKPAYQVRETSDAYAATVHLPGVAKTGLEVTATAEEIRVVGRRAWSRPAGWTPLYRESGDETFELVLAHGHTVDPDRIAAELTDGVLRLSLPKAGAVKPRRIAVA
jgi:HSP20 family molecular chaperone IbpA